MLNFMSSCDLSYDFRAKHVKAMIFFRFR